MWQVTLDSFPASYNRKMKRSEYRQRSIALRAPYEAAKLLWTTVPTESNRDRVADVFEIYNALQERLFDRYCRQSV